jgi:hypothetical protein
MEYDETMAFIGNLPITPRIIPPEFKPWGKTPRWQGLGVTLTEKIDGTNALVCVHEGRVYAGSRNRWLDVSKKGDNFGFAKWCVENESELLKLGEGYHYGEWWGHGIGRGYGTEPGLIVPNRTFSLFNTRRWDNTSRPECCSVVPVLYQGVLDFGKLEKLCDDLKRNGSVAATGYMRPEGVVMYIHQLDAKFKIVFDKDGPSPIEES